jgi:hypothetical protein
VNELYFHLTPAMQDGLLDLDGLETFDGLLDDHDNGPCG